MLLPLHSFVKLPATHSKARLRKGQLSQQSSFNTFFQQAGRHSHVPSPPVQVSGGAPPCTLQCSGARVTDMDSKDDMVTHPNSEAKMLSSWGPVYTSQGVSLVKRYRQEWAAYGLWLDGDGDVWAEHLQLGIAVDAWKP